MSTRQAFRSRDWSLTGRASGRRPLVLAACPTPFHTGVIDLAGVEENLRFLDAAGIDGVLVAGTTGGNAGLRRGERVALVERAAQSVAADFIIISGVGPGHDVGAIVEEIGSLHAAGADLVLVPPPLPVPGQPRAGLVRETLIDGTRDESIVAPFFAKLVAASPLPVLAYQPPSFREAPLSPATMNALGQVVGLAGVKDSVGDASVLDGWPRRGDPRFGRFVGSASLFETAAVRVTGAILALASIHPSQYLEMARRAAAAAPIDDLREALRPSRERFETGRVPALKEMHEELGLFGGDGSREEPP